MSHFWETRRAFLGALAAPVLAAAADNWIDLFDGRTLDGWRPSENKESWKVRDGALVMLGAAGALGTVDEKDVLEEAGRGRRDVSLRSGGLGSDPEIFWAATGAPSRILMARLRPDSRPVEPALRVLVQLAGWSEGAPGASPAAACGWASRPTS